MADAEQMMKIVPLITRPFPCSQARDTDTDIDTDTDTDTDLEQ